MAHVQHRVLGRRGNMKGTVTHGGHGGSVGIANLWREGITSSIEDINDDGGEEPTEVRVVSAWEGQYGADAGNATQSTVNNRPVLFNDYSLDFRHTSDSAEYGDYMTFDSKTRIAGSTPFMSFLVCNLDSSSTSCYLSDSGAEVLQFTSGNAHQIKAGSATNMTHSSKFTVPDGSKFLMVVARVNTQDIKLWKNGIECNGHQNLGSSTTGVLDIVSLGVKNVGGTPSNFFDGKIYDVIVIDDMYDDAVRRSIQSYLIRKHGLELEASD